MLYLALEDDFQRIQSRIFMMYGVNDTCLLYTSFQRLPLGGKAPFELLLALTLPVGVTELHIPGAVILVLKRCHNYSPFLAVSVLVP